MSYINPTPGVANSQVKLLIDLASVNTGFPANVTLAATALSIPALVKSTVNNTNGVYEWSQLDSSSKHSITTVSTNSLVADLILDENTFWGNAAAASGTIAQLGMFAVANAKTKVAFKIRVSANATTGAGTTLSGVGYISALAPTVTADQPVWQSPFTIMVDGEYTVTKNDAAV